MWERIKYYLNSLQHETDIDTVAEEIVEFLKETELSEEDQYDIEMAMYGIMDNTRTVRSFIKKVGKVIRNKTEHHELELFEKGAHYFDDDEWMGDQDALDIPED